jgi:hypothetical protein
MRLSVIDVDKDESIFYNLGVFAEHENLIVFLTWNLPDFYDEMEKRL